MTPKLFDKYLPYAMALDVDQKWSEDFDRIISELNANDEYFERVWYDVEIQPRDLKYFSSNLNKSFSRSVQQMKAPAEWSDSSGDNSSGSAGSRSSSGSSGGNSGKGRGGGGGGGW
jgi:uncharacterized membrane protein